MWSSISFTQFKWLWLWVSVLMCKIVSSLLFANPLSCLQSSNCKIVSSLLFANSPTDEKKHDTEEHSRQWPYCKCYYSNYDNRETISRHIRQNIITSIITLCNETSPVSWQGSRVVVETCEVRTRSECETSHVLLVCVSKYCPHTTQFCSWRITTMKFWTIQRIYTLLK